MPVKESESLAILRPRSADDFLDAAGDLLQKHEAENNLMLGLCVQINEGLYDHKPGPYFAVLHDDDGVVGAALRTPPHNLILSYRFPRGGLEAIAADVASEFGELPGVIAERDVSLDFARVWSRRAGPRYMLGVRQRIFSADSISRPLDVPGALRPANQDDRKLLASWMIGFAADALGNEADRQDVERSLDYLLKFRTGGLFVWEDHGPVSMAGYGGPTPNGIRINAVYTPPVLRRRGYASACVAHLSQHLLDEDRRLCFLFTDLSNPTSNKIYKRIGYRPVCDVDEYHFASTEGTRFRDG